MFGDQKSYDVWRRKVCEKKVEIFNFRRKSRIYLGSTWTIVNPSGFMLKKKICSKKLSVSCTSWFSLVPQLYFPGALMENLCCRIIAEYVVVFLRCSNSISLVPQLYFLAAPNVDLCCRQLESSRLVSSGSSLSRTGHAPRYRWCSSPTQRRATHSSSPPSSFSAPLCSWSSGSYSSLQTWVGCS